MNESKFFVVDAHEDIAFNAVSLKRDFRKSAFDIRASENAHPEHGSATIGLPELLQGNVRVIFATLWANPCNNTVMKVRPCYSTPEEARSQAIAQLDYYKSLEENQMITIIRTKNDLQSVLNSAIPRVGVVILMEGADPILSAKDVPEWFDLGVRIIGPAWHRTRYAGGTGEPGPLTDIGRELVREMDNLGIILDGSHFAEESFYEALDLFKGQVIVSHANCRALCPGDRHLSDDMILSLVARDGIMGIVTYNGFLEPKWEAEGKIKSSVTYASAVRHINHVRDLAGDNLHVGLGSDLDGGYGVEGAPLELETVADLRKLEEPLRKQDYSQLEIENILGGNWVRILKKGLPSS